MKCTQIFNEKLGQSQNQLTNIYKMKTTMIIFRLTLIVIIGFIVLKIYPGKNRLIPLIKAATKPIQIKAVLDLVL